MPKPDEYQVRAAKVRAAIEAYEKKHRKPYAGGWEYPTSEKIYKAVAKITGESVYAISFITTYSRTCEHPWSKGACPKCPDASHIPWDKQQNEAAVYKKLPKVIKDTITEKIFWLKSYLYTAEKHKFSKKSILDARNKLKQLENFKRK